MVYLGIATCRRPARLAALLSTVAAELPGLVGEVGIVHDGPPDPETAALEGFPDLPGLRMWRLPARRGVAAVKNELLRRAVDLEADWIILAEDDQLVLTADAVTGYVKAAEASGIEHLCFHAHGPANRGPDRGADPTGTVTFWPHYVGAWCLTSAAAVHAAGPLDEDMYNALEHVEWTLRIAAAGFCPLPGGLAQNRVADATGSEGWLAEQPGSIDDSAILVEGGREGQRARTAAARAVWRERRPDTYRLVFNR